MVDSVKEGLLERLDATADTMRDGWLHTGDLFRVDADGALVLVDRLKDLIITGEQNVYLAEVEHAVMTHPSALDSTVIDQPHQEYGETEVAVVALAEGVDLAIDALREHWCAAARSVQDSASPDRPRVPSPQRRRQAAEAPAPRSRTARSVVPSDLGHLVC